MSGKQHAVMWLLLILIIVRLFTTKQWSSLWAALTYNANPGGPAGSNSDSGSVSACDKIVPPILRLLPAGKAEYQACLAGGGAIHDAKKFFDKAGNAPPPPKVTIPHNAACPTGYTTTVLKNGKKTCTPNGVPGRL